MGTSGRLQPRAPSGGGLAEGGKGRREVVGRRGREEGGRKEEGGKGREEGGRKGERVERKEGGREGKGCWVRGKRGRGRKG